MHLFALTHKQHERKRTPFLVKNFGPILSDGICSRKGVTIEKRSSKGITLANRLSRFSSQSFSFRNKVILKRTIVAENRRDAKKSPESRDTKFLSHQQGLFLFHALSQHFTGYRILEIQRWSIRGYRSSTERILPGGYIFIHL